MQDGPGLEEQNLDGQNPGEQSLAAREHAHSPSQWARDADASLAQQAEQGRTLRERYPPLRLAYGDADHAWLHLHRPAGDGPWPLMIFFHGGYWQALDATATDFMAERWLARGWAFASLNYPLAPDASLETQIGESIRGVRYLLDKRETLGLSDRVRLGGHSAGAHLALMSGLAPACRQAIEALWLISGVFDLRPLLGTSIARPLDLDEDRATRLSPLCLPLTGLPTLELIHGEQDPPVFQQQGEALAAKARREGVPATVTLLAERDHFDILEYADTALEHDTGDIPHA
ncbi:alpha/beta hydrolase [Halomonas sp. GD1P12]|uniref:alpha/beta hydrolase n=1 Tax=Halomonas sp. GD1P12 TaxID=2982691 RepID=UPI0021E4CD25|nr:alpha/beta hydrolase [Halomonas sp. GD1P12]UYG00187.1 alpha/beta hydrolase [Halomonas sp. GD1P12]